jgi:hypothetical protein
MLNTLHHRLVHASTAIAFPDRSPISSYTTSTCRNRVSPGQNINSILSVSCVKSESVPELHNSHYTPVSAVVERKDSRIPPPTELGGLLRRTR